jgi:ribosomal protein S18 acetylase RimI-like enzyme
MGSELNNNIRLLNPKECLELAEALGDTPETAIGIHFLKRGLCRAYVSGDPSNFNGIIVQNILYPAELMGFGSEPDILWELLKSMGGWDCIEVETECSMSLGKIMESETGLKVRYYDDIYYTLPKPAIIFQNDFVRQLTIDDLELIESSPDDIKESGYENYRSLLTEGFSAGAIISGKLVGIAHTSAQSKLYSDIGIFVLDGYRNRGFATASASIVAQRVQESGQTPIWSTGKSNFASQRVAQKIGFVEFARRIYVILDKR